MTDTLAVETTTPASAERDLPLLTRNPVVEIVDCRDAAPARSWKQHKAFVDGLAEKRGLGAIFAVVQQRGDGRGFWVTEWTVTTEGGRRQALRRRAATATTLDAAVSAFRVELSFHNSHYFRPEEGVLGRFRR